MTIINTQLHHPQRLWMIVGSMPFFLFLQVNLKSDAIIIKREGVKIIGEIESFLLS
jgi:hypothetical protein